MKVVNKIITNDTYTIQDPRLDPIVTAKRKCIIIGDSYGDGYTPDGSVTSWSTQLKNALSNDYDEIVTNTLGGTGFIINRALQKSFKTLLEEVNIADKESVRDIIVCGGYNDTGNDLQSVDTAVGVFCDYAKNQYPNAIVSIGMIGCDMDNNERILSLIDNVLRGYSMCGKYGNARFIGNSETILHNRNQFSSDRYHPNQTGQDDIFSKILCFLRGGNINNNWGFIPNYEVGNGLESPYDCKGQINEFCSSGTTGFELFYFGFTTPVTIPQGQVFVICDLKQTNLIKSGYQEMTKKNVEVLVGYEGGKYEYCNLQVCINNNYIAIVNQILSDDGYDFKNLENVKSINFLGASFYYPQQYI